MEAEGGKGIVRVKLLALLHRLYHRDTICQSFEKCFYEVKTPAHACQKQTRRKQNLPMQTGAGRAVMEALGPRGKQEWPPVLVSDACLSS